MEQGDFNSGKTSDVTNFSFLLPFAATICGIVFINEKLNAGKLIGGSIVILSIAIFSKKGRNEFIEG